MAVCALTTLDNPFNPFEDWQEWYEFDTSHGYHSTALLGRLTATSHEMSEELEEQLIEQAIDEFIAVDPLAIYRKVVKE